jgi:hypothetical protein
VLVSGCASAPPLPRSPIPAPLTETQAMILAEEYLDDQGVPDDRFIASVEPLEDGKLVSFRSRFDEDGKPPVQSRLVEVKNKGTVREITFR